MLEGRPYPSQESKKTPLGRAISATVLSLNLLLAACGVDSAPQQEQLPGQTTDVKNTERPQDYSSVKWSEALQVMIKDRGLSGDYSLLVENNIERIFVMADKSLVNVNFNDAEFAKLVNKIRSFANNNSTLKSSYTVQDVTTGNQISMGNVDVNVTPINDAIIIVLKAESAPSGLTSVASVQVPDAKDPKDSSRRVRLIEIGVSADESTDLLQKVISTEAAQASVSLTTNDAKLRSAIVQEVFANSLSVYLASRKSGLSHEEAINVLTYGVDANGNVLATGNAGPILPIDASNLDGADCFNLTLPAQLGALSSDMIVSLSNKQIKETAKQLPAQVYDRRFDCKRKGVLIF